MGIAERREREKLEVRRQILDAARQLFAREGWDNVTMRRIAEAIEYSPTTIYLHFEDKNALIEALCFEDMSRMLAVFAGVPQHPDPVEMIRQIGLAYARFGLDNPHHYRFMFMTPTPPDMPRPPVGERADNPGEQSFGFLVQAVARAVREGQLRDEGVLAMAHQFWASLHGAIALLTTYRPEEMPGGPPPEDLPERIIDSMLNSFRKES